MTHATQPKGGTEKSVLLFCIPQADTISATTAGGQQPLIPPASGSPLFYPPFPLYTALIPPYTVTASPEALCPSGPAFSVAKVLPRKHIQVPLRYLNIIFRQLSRFPIVHISQTLDTAAIKFRPNSLFVVSF